METNELKEALLQQCFSWINDRHQRILKTLDDIKTALLEESKSSAGDKHETGRAMLQIERENAGHQLQEIENVKKNLAKIQLQTITEFAHLGSLVLTDKANYFLSISAGKVVVENKDYYCISPKSPIGSLLIGKQLGATFIFNKNEIEVISIE